MDRVYRRGTRRLQSTEGNRCVAASLDATFFSWTATVVWDGCHVLQRLYIEPGGLQGGNGAFTPRSGPPHAYIDVLDAKLQGLSAACCAAHCPANGVLLRLPLKPQVPALAQHSVSPFVSVIVTVVLLKVATMWAIPAVTLRRGLRFFPLAIVVLFKRR